MLSHQRGSRSLKADGEPTSLDVPVFRLQAVKPVVVFLVQRSLQEPVDQTLRKEPHEDLLEPGDTRNIQGKTPTRHPADDPGPLPGAEERLPEGETTKTAVKNSVKPFLSFPYHLCRSADLHGNIASGVADADHQHPHAPVSLRISVLPGVEAFSRKALVSWRVGGGAQVKKRPARWKTLFRAHQPGKSDSGREG